MTKITKRIAGLLALTVLGAGCTHTVTIDSPAEAVELNITIQVQQEILVALADTDT